VAGLPHKVQLHQKYADQGLVVVALNMEGEVKADKVSPMISKLKIDVLHNLLLGEGMTEEANAAVECEGLIPQMNLYDRRGRLRHKIVDDLEPQELELLIEELLKESNG
jgi:hypothetical protein